MYPFPYPCEKKLQRSKRVTKNLGKFLRTTCGIASMLGYWSDLFFSHKQCASNTASVYSSLMSLYDCPCNYHCSRREELRRLHQQPTTGREDVLEEHAEQGKETIDTKDASESLSDSDADNGGGDIDFHAELEVESGGETSTNEDDESQAFAAALSLQLEGKAEDRSSEEDKRNLMELNEKAERFITSFREQQRLQRQMSFEDYFQMLVRSV